MPLEKYLRKYSRAAGSPAISVTPQRVLVLNAAATRLFANAATRSVFLLWDPTEGRLAIRRAEQGAENSFTLSTKASQARLTAKGFLRHVGWIAQARQMINATWDASSQSLEATLPVEFLAGSQARTAE